MNCTAATTSPKINKIEIQGFRALDRKRQTLAFGSLLSAVWAPDSQGTKRLAEAFEVLLTGQIVRRQPLASTRDEFANALRNARMPAGMPACVEAELSGADRKPHMVRRTLISDYAKRQDCQSALQIDGKDAKEGDTAGAARVQLTKGRFFGIIPVCRSGAVLDGERTVYQCLVTPDRMCAMCNFKC